MAKKPNREPSPTSEGEKPKTPTKEELLKLPRWARVAFAARCARRVQPLFVKHWPKAPKEHIEAVERAITLAESSARAGRAEDLVTTAAASRAAAAYAAATISATARATAAARATAYAATTATTTAARAAADAAADAATAADTAADAYTAYPAYPAMRRDFNRLLTLAREEKWTSDTPVDPDWLGPIGNIDEADSVPATRTPQPDDVLELTLRVPAAASDEEIKLLVKQFVLSASKYHLAHGGSGLKPGTVEVYAVAASPAGVPA